MESRAQAADDVGRTRPAVWILVLLCFCICAYVLAPLSYGDARVLAPKDREPDAVLGTQLLGGGMDKLLSDPLAYYDTAVLYPDWNQLRTTEPFLGFALLGLPLRIFHFNDSDVFEALRWAIILTSLIYGYLLFRAVGIDRCLCPRGHEQSEAEPGSVRRVDRIVRRECSAAPAIAGGDDRIGWQRAQPVADRAAQT